MFDNVPEEMKQFPQWCIWRYEDRQGDKPTKVPYSARTGRLASVSDSGTWATFEEAKNAHRLSGYDGIGFILSETDPYTFIDLDDTKGDAAALERQMAIYQEFESYAERSPSGSGLHIIIKGAVPSGRKRNYIEVYSSHRYMTMTGNVFRDKPICDYNAQINSLWEQMSPSFAHSVIYAGSAPESESDDVIISKIINAENGVKANALLVGNWYDYYPSQSEADFAFIDIIAFYTQNKNQIIRIFKNSGLGQREKASRIDYLNWMINKSFDRILPAIDTDGLRDKIEKAIESNKPEPKKKKEKQNESKPIDIPPGLVGELARFIFDQAPRPVPEIALVGAIGLVSGIIGRAYNVSGTGLNQYLILLGATGVGKEAIASGIDKLMNCVIKTVPAAIEFIGPGEVASSQALIKYMSKAANSFVSLWGEFGIYLQDMGSKTAPPHLKGLKRMLLDLYNKSGEGKVLRPSIWSDKEKNTASILSPAFTLIGESTQEEFYEGLHEGMVTSGLLPRISIIEYNGNRPYLNKEHQKAVPSKQLIEDLSTICSHSLMLNSQHKAIHVLFTPEAQQMFNDYDRWCDDKINSAEKEIFRHLYNRGHIKALKLAAVIAVGCNPYEPTITLDIGKWAINMINGDIENISKRFNSGEVGENQEEILQIKALIKNSIKYTISDWEGVKGYKCGTYDSHRAKFIPYSYLHKRLSLNNAFKKDKRGATEAIKRTIKTLIERGDLAQISPVVLSKDFGIAGNYYIIKNMGLLSKEEK